MNILVINSDCLCINSSANLCHIAYIKGLLDSGHSVTVLSADSNNQKTDDSISIPDSAKTYYYNGLSLYQKLSEKKHVAQSEASTEVSTATFSKNSNSSLKQRAVRTVKDFILSLYGVHGIYITFVKNAKRFSSSEKFNLVISLSTPPSSHLLAYKLIKSNRIHAEKWIQIWEDPWYSDAYGFNGKVKIREEERKLLSYAQHICYVSPLTLENQKRLYPESAHKMYWQPLPYYYKNETQNTKVFTENSYGYFGDYAPASRDLRPFYEAAKEAGISVSICGNPSKLFSSTDNIHIYPRLNLERLKPIEDSANVLVFLCNRQGGQIPGKIYQYSATDKTILFILDGTDYDKEVLTRFFGKYNRYVFCDNNKDSISEAIKKIESNQLGDIKNEPLEAFNPRETIRKILECESND